MLYLIQELPGPGDVFFQPASDIVGPICHFKLNKANISTCASRVDSEQCVSPFSLSS